ncbi:MAG: FAD-dependent oxidoreductase [Deltaproteobacteria bacterium]|nr:FAD-dependent oxidoreductase [Deltaproteobacteria bacterium]
MFFSKKGKIGDINFSNRFLMAGVKTAYGNGDGKVTPRHISYYTSIADGGVSMVILEPMSVSPHGMEHPKQLTIHNEFSSSELKKLTDIIHEKGSTACINLNHAGRAANPMATKTDPLAPSEVICGATGKTAKELTKLQIEEILGDWKQALINSQNAGFDAVEIQAGHGYLVQQFLSTETNKRTDEYGKDPALFMKKLFDIVKNNRGKMAVIVRISGNDFGPVPFTPENNRIIIEMAEKSGFDAIHTGFGNACTSPPWYYSHMALPENPQIDAVRKIRKMTTLPLIVAGRMGSFEKLELFENEDLCDFIALGRPLVADPQFVNKYLENRRDDITRCGYCLQGCLANVKNGKGLGCIANPSVDSTPALRKIKGKIAVIGGGPAGMTSAIWLSKWGADVTLFEKEKSLGGQFTQAPKAPFKESMTKPLGSIIRQCEATVKSIKLNYEITQLDPGEFDHVIVATGSVTNSLSIPGIENQYVINGTDFFENPSLVKGDRVLILGAGMIGVEAAEILGKNHHVTITKRTDTIANDMEMITKKLLMARLEKNSNITVSLNTSVKEFTDDEVKYEIDGNVLFWRKFDTVINATGMSPLDEIALKLREKGIKITLAGDALQTGDIYTATSGGFNAASEVADSLQNS